MNHQVKYSYSSDTAENGDIIEPIWRFNISSGFNFHENMDHTTFLLFAFLLVNISYTQSCMYTGISMYYYYAK